MLEQLLSNAFPKNSKGSFRDDLADRAGNRLSNCICGRARLGSGTLQQIGEQFSLGPAEDAFVAQQGAGKTIDYFSCCHRIPPGEETRIQGPGNPVNDGGLEDSKKNHKREEAIGLNSEENWSEISTLRPWLRPATQRP
jgi:hypothetical protein